MALFRGALKRVAFMHKIMPRLQSRLSRLSRNFLAVRRGHGQLQYLNGLHRSDKDLNVERDVS